MKRFFILLMTVAAVLTGCRKTGSVVLNGRIEGGSPEFIVIVYSQDKYPDYMYPELQDGRFRLEMDDVKGFIDFGVALDGEVYGAHIKACDSLNMLFTATDDGGYEVRYQGNCEKESRMFKDFYDTYGYWGQYNIRPDRDSSVTTEESFRLIDGNDAAFRAKYGSGLGRYYRRRAELTCYFLKSVLLDADACEAGGDVVKNPAFCDMMAKVDPEEPLTISCGLLGRWLRYKLSGLHCSERQKPLRFIDSKDGRISSLEARKGIVDYFCSSAMLEIKQEDDAYYYDFFDRMAGYIKEDSLLVQDYRGAYQKKKESLSVKTLPDLTLTAPDGGGIQLSSLYGKVLYIDIWASWCGPCCNEIPHLAEMVGKLRAEGIEAGVISISVDGDTDAWKAGLSKHKPGWPQYILSEEDHYRLSEALAMKTIPRFVLLAPDGTILSPDAERPSSGDTILEEIRSAAAGSR